MTYLFSRDGVDGGSAVALVCLQPSLLLSFASVPYALVFLQLQFRCFFCVCFWVFLLSFIPWFCDFFRLFPPVFWFFFLWVLLALCFTDFFSFLPPAVHGFFFFPWFCPFFSGFSSPFQSKNPPPPQGRLCLAFIEPAVASVVVMAGLLNAP